MLGALKGYGQTSLIQTGSLHDQLKAQQHPRHRHCGQPIVRAQHVRGRQLQDKQAPPQQGLPTEDRKQPLPASSTQPKAAVPDVSASDRTLNVIVRVGIQFVNKIYRRCLFPPVLLSVQKASVISSTGGADQSHAAI